MIRTHVVTAALVLAGVGGVFAGFEPSPFMDWVIVGDPGNADDTHGVGYGGVDYVYYIGKYEVTNAQYAEFLNAVAADDPNGLYNTSMGSGFGGITRSGSSGSHTYNTITGRGNMPVVYVSWYDTLRFANWMHNGRPSGAQDASTTEDGAYDMSLGSGAVRKPGARVFLASEDEWYKAAYYKGGGPSAGYWDYPTESDTAPTAEGPSGSDFVNGSANYDRAIMALTYVGSYMAKPSDSAYLTCDQGGNVYEWTEQDFFSSTRPLRGGMYESNAWVISADAGGQAPLASEYGSVGFRVAAVFMLDGDGDGDVDLDDFALFQAAFTGPNP